MKAYSKEKRREVLAACDEGAGTKVVALRFGVSESWVRRVKQERRELGKTAPCTTRRRVPKWHRYKDRICEMVNTCPDMTLGELSESLDGELSRGTLCKALRKLKLTLKKKSSERPSKTGRMSHRSEPSGR